MVAKNETLVKLSNAGRKRPVKKPVRKVVTNHVILLLDESGSMGSIRQETVDAHTNQVTNILAEARKARQKVNVSTITFNHVVNQADSNFSAASYRPGGSTNLHGAIVEAIRWINVIRQKNDTALLVVITDGQETQFHYTDVQVRDAIGKAMQDENFNVVGNAPPGGRSILINLGIPAANVTEWEATSKGVAKLGRVMGSAFTGYFGDIGAGKTVREATSSYMANMDNITPNDVNSMTDVSNQFKRWRVDALDHELEIREFVTRKGLQFAVGRGFYELTKSERVSAGKIILILDRQTGAVYSGDQARRKLGLPVGKEIRVKPGTSGEFTLFIQSTSYNRKLMGGTTLLYQV